MRETALQKMIREGRRGGGAAGTGAKMAFPFPASPAPPNHSTGRKSCISQNPNLTSPFPGSPERIAWEEGRTGHPCHGAAQHLGILLMEDSWAESPPPWAALLTALPNRHAPYPFLVTESSTRVRITRERPHTSQSTGNCACLNPTGARSKDVSGETCLFARGTLHVQEHGRAKTRECTGATAQPPVLGPNTLFHGKARARSAHNFPSCTDLIKMKRSCHSQLADQLEPAVRFDAGYRLYCQILSNHLSCFTGLPPPPPLFVVVLFRASLHWQSSARLLGKSLTLQSVHATDRGFSLEFNVIASIYHFNSLMKVRCN